MAPTLRSLLKGRGTLKFLLPLAAVSGALTFGAPSAHALQVGNLEFADGTGDFASEVNITDPTDTFSVLFNTGANPLALVSGAGGLFVPPFAPAPPSAAVGISSALAGFTFFAPVNPFQALYTLDNDTAFTFSNGVTVGIFGGVQFLVTQGGTAVQVEVTQNFAPDLTSFVTGLPGGAVVVTAGAFTFNDTIQTTGGSYSAQVNVAREDTVPGPLPILGAGVAFGYSRRLRKRVKTAAVSA
ncbi:hypothetical protein VB738_07505 [Cyanobium gracile UHCC 0139]|uniref:PEP-CTERM sorting domain-containing protein n=1 Tax=Cyanobium gracile UHCC 0139 TaxID=3110308 RepID=A0ABU5RTP1_9CYAN|nr:hypothetical protein [Cyanobium gracile]MEA5391107.1 hypothetical protein [Cyanobium gracile UHCC 0139]